MISAELAEPKSTRTESGRSVAMPPGLTGDGDLGPVRRPADVDVAARQQLAGDVDGVVDEAARVVPQVEDDAGRSRLPRAAERGHELVAGAGRELVDPDVGDGACRGPSPSVTAGTLIFARDRDVDRGVARAGGSP